MEHPNPVMAALAARYRGFPKRSEETKREAQETRPERPMETLKPAPVAEK